MKKNECSRVLIYPSGFSFFYIYDAVIYDTVYVNKYFRCKNWRAQIIPCSPISFSMNNFLLVCPGILAFYTKTSPGIANC